jgi:hypothetical protein
MSLGAEAWSANAGTSEEPVADADTVAPGENGGLGSGAVRYSGGLPLGTSVAVAWSVVTVTTPAESPGVDEPVAVSTAVHAPPVPSVVEFAGRLPNDAAAAA